MEFLPRKKNRTHELHDLEIKQTNKGVKNIKKDKKSRCPFPQRLLEHARWSPKGKKETREGEAIITPIIDKRLTAWTKNEAWTVKVSAVSCQAGVTRLTFVALRTVINCCSQTQTWERVRTEEINLSHAH